MGSFVNNISASPLFYRTTPLLLRFNSAPDLVRVKVLDFFRVYLI